MEIAAGKNSPASELPTPEGFTQIPYGLIVVLTTPQPGDLHHGESRSALSITRLSRTPSLVVVQRGGNVIYNDSFLGLRFPAFFVWCILAANPGQRPRVIVLRSVSFYL